MKRNGLIISALRGGSGKTVISVGITAALKAQGKNVVAFKKGPDYIDAGWLALAAGRPCRNLDTFLCAPEAVLHSFHANTSLNHIAVIEGNRGLYDGIEIEGTTSTAELSKLLDIPAIVILDCTKSTRTMAAALLGLLHFDPGVKIKAAIVNKVAGKRHETILRNTIEHHTGISVAGAIPRQKNHPFPERHMGLVPTPEHDWALEAVREAEKMVANHVDMDMLCNFALDNQAGIHTAIQPTLPEETASSLSTGPRIGVMRDSAFQFYYLENLEALENAGAKIVYTSPLTEKHLPEIDALYIGGGFPETHAQALADNQTYRDDILHLAQNGLPVYAECGGLMFLGKNLKLEGKVYPMAGVLPVSFGFSKRPQGHGYTIFSVDKENPFLPARGEYRGHEFHYSTIEDFHGKEDDLIFSMQRGKGIIAQKDGLYQYRTLATYSHIHALGCTVWAKQLIRAASENR